MSVDISGLDKCELLYCLWKNTITASFFSSTGVTPPEFDKTQLKAVNSYIDYYSGRPIKCDISQNTASSSGYNRDAGAGKFEKVVADMRSGR